MNTAVICKNIVKTYGEGASKVTALKGINLEVKTGELLMLVGPSGCGKTTLISVISSILQQDSGECLIFGHDVNRFSENERTYYRGRHIGFVFQSFNLIPMLNAKENVSVPLILNGMERLEALERAEDLLIRVGLKERMDHLPNQLSGGEQQRVAISRGCIHEPQLIVCDEPTSALDHQTGEKVIDILKSLTSRKNCALIIVTHDERIFHFADRIAKLDDGRIISTNAPPKKSTLPEL